MLIPLNYSSFEVSYLIPQSHQMQGIFYNSQCFKILSVIYFASVFWKMSIFQLRTPILTCIFQVLTAPHFKEVLSRSNVTNAMKRSRTFS